MPETTSELARSGTPRGTMSDWPYGGSRLGVAVREAGHVRTIPALPPAIWASRYACVRSSMTHCWAVQLRLDLLAQGPGPATEQHDLPALGLGPATEKQDLLALGLGPATEEHSWAVERLPLPRVSALGAQKQHLLQCSKQNA